MRAFILPAEGHIRIDDEPMTIPAGQMPDAPVLDGFVADPKRPIKAIQFDGAIGTIERFSRAAGKIDFEHFVGADPLAPYAAAFAAEKDRQAKVKAQKNEAEEARAKDAANLAQVAADEGKKV